MEITIREMFTQDAAQVSALSAELGYPANSAEMRQRIERLSARSDHALFVACDQEEIVGWIDVALSEHLTSSPSGLIGGLIVSGAARGRGIGHALVDRAEAWTRAAGAGKIVVRSRLTRERAHQFYLQQGYIETKRQAVFTKEL